MATGFSSQTMSWQSQGRAKQTPLPLPPGRESDYRSPSPERDEYGRIRTPTVQGHLSEADRVHQVRGEKMSNCLHATGHNQRQRSRGLHSQAGSLISYGQATVYHGSSQPGSPTKGGADAGAAALSNRSNRSQPGSPTKGGGAAINLMLTTDENTMPGDLLIRKSGLPITSRMAALVRQRQLDVAALITDFLKRSATSKIGPQRSHNFVDIPTFRRALCYAFGEQWTILAMTSPEFEGVYSPYIVRDRGPGGDVLLNWKAFSADLSDKAGVRAGNLGYLLEEEDLDDRMSSAGDHRSKFGGASGAVDDVQRAMESLYSHDIETEAEKQEEVLKDVERVTGARSVAVTRYGSYESKLHGRNSMGIIKQGEFDQIGQSEEEAAAIRKAQGINADGSRVKTVNTQISGQTHEFRADGSIEVSGEEAVYDARKAASATPYNQAALQSAMAAGGVVGARAQAAAAAQAAAMNAHQAKALAFQQRMQAQFGKEVESQLQADDEHSASAFRDSSTYGRQVGGGGTRQQQLQQLQQRQQQQQLLLSTKPGHSRAGAMTISPPKRRVVGNPYS